MDIIYKDESYRIVGACFEVYNKIGCGFPEAVYQECLELEFELQHIPFHTQSNFKLAYKDTIPKKSYTPDFLCYDKIIVEIKAVSELVDLHRDQVQNYLKATEIKLGLLINFGQSPRLIYERIVR